MSSSCSSCGDNIEVPSDVSAFDCRTFLSTSLSVCIECEGRVVNHQLCDVCQCALCDESCALAHSLWCSSHSRVLGNLFDAHMRRYCAVDDFFRNDVNEAAMERFQKNGGFKPVTMTAEQLRQSQWTENTVCIDIECLFFALANHRFPNDRFICDSANLLWHSNSAACGNPLNKPMLADGTNIPVGTPHECTYVMYRPSEKHLEGRQITLYKFDIRALISADLHIPGINVAYLIMLADCTATKKFKNSHLLMLRLCGKTAFLVQAYVGMYTFAEWCEWSQPLVPDRRRQTRMKAKFIIKPLGVDAQPKFRGLLSSAQVLEFVETLLKLVGGIDRDECWRHITGIREPRVPQIRIATMRLNLTAPKI